MEEHQQEGAYPAQSVDQVHNITDLLMIRPDLVKDLPAEEIQHGQNHQHHHEDQRIDRTDPPDHKIILLLSGSINLIQTIPYGHQSLSRSPQSNHYRENGKGWSSIRVDIRDHPLHVGSQILRKDPKQQIRDLSLRKRQKGRYGENEIDHREEG